MPRKIDVAQFRVPPGKSVDLGKWPTKVKPFYDSDEDYKVRLEEHREQLRKKQDVLFAHNRYSLLIIFQAMDAAGKDSAIGHVMSGVNPQGCQVYSFKHPSEEELDHDFLWRTTRNLPARGNIGIFNRSYYEEVLIVRVHPEILRAQRLPQEALDHSGIWKKRFESIFDTEEHLWRNGTRIIKFFLHISKAEQRRRLLRRIDDPQKNWKFNFADLEEREVWADYMKAYEECLGATSTKRAPWYAVPADDKKNARLIISRVIVQALRELPLRYPEPDASQRRKLLAIRRRLLPK